MTPYYSAPDTTMYVGDVLDALAALPDESVQCVVTSPPYWGLRDYLVEGQIGLEATPEGFVARLVEVFRDVRRVLRADGVMFLNLGDSYAGSASGIKPKDLVGIPWRVAFALQADGWWLRSDIIWAKPNPMPESVSDRPTKAHEYLFLLTKRANYYYDADAIREPLMGSSVARLAQNVEGQAGSDRAHGGSKTNGTMKAVGGARSSDKQDGQQVSGANKRSVWEIATQPFSGWHFATFPEALVEPCVLAGSRPGDVVLDPFGGSGTVSAVARRLGRRSVYIDLNPEYAALAVKRLEAVPLAMRL